MKTLIVSCLVIIVPFSSYTPHDNLPELLKKNSETLRMATVETAKAVERPIVDIETLQKEYRSKIDTIKKSDLDEDKKKEQITHLKCELDRKLERVKGISVPRYDSAEEKAYQHIKIMSKFSQEEMKALNETETSVMHMIRNFAQEHGYVYDRNKNKFIKVVTKTLADDMKGDVIAE